MFPLFLILWVFSSHNELLPRVIADGSSDAAGANVSMAFDTTNLTTDAFRQTFAVEKYAEPKMVFYDEFGDLIVNGQVPGQSKPIVLDYKKYHNSCTSNIHFFFTFIVPGDGELEQTEKIFEKEGQTLTQADVADMFSSCPYGLTFCYEGQLDGEGLHDEYRVTNYFSEMEEGMDLPSQKIALQCMLVNDIPNAHGFNMAIVAMPGLNMSEMEWDKKINPKFHPNKYTYYWRFFVLTLSITKDEYYFIVPSDGKVTLQIGDRKSMDTYFTDSEGNVLPPVQFTYYNESYGTLKLGNEDLPDPANQVHFEDHRGLWLLYMDFKRPYNELQIVSSVHSEDCEMIGEIRGNRMRKCRTFLEDIAVTDPSDASLDFIFTSEVGDIRRSDSGQEDVQEMLDKSEREELRKKTEKSKNDTEKASSEKNATETAEKKGHEEHKTKTESFKAKASVTASAQFTKPPKKKGGGGGGGRKGRRGGGGSRGGGKGGGNGGGKGGGNGGGKGGGTGGGKGGGTGGGKGGGTGGRKGGGTGGGKGGGTGRSGGGGGRGRGGGRGGGGGPFGDILGSARRMGGNALKGAQNAGMNFLNQAANGGLSLDSISKLNPESLVDDIKKKAMEKVNQGINQLKNVTDMGKKMVNNYITDAKKFGEDLMKKGQGAIDKIRTGAENIVGNAKDQVKAYQDQLQKKAGQMGSGIGSLLSRTYDGGNGLMNKMGTQLGKFAANGPAALNKLTDRMQNLVPTSCGGALQGFGDKARSFIPGGLSVDKITQGVQNAIGSGGINLDGAKKFTQNMLNMPQGVRLPSSFNEVKKMVPGMDKLSSMAGGLGEKFKNTGGSLIDRANPAALLDKMNVNQYKPDISKWTNKVPNYQNYVPKVPKVPKGITDIGKRFGRRKRQTANIDAGAAAELSETNQEHSSKSNDKDNSDSGSGGTRMYENVSKSKSLMESFKSTSGIANTLTTSEFLLTSQAFTKKEIVDVKISGLPPNKKFVISQLMFECDGNVIKLPKIIFHNGEEVIEGLSESVMGNKVQSIGNQQGKVVQANGTAVNTANATTAKNGGKVEQNGGMTGKSFKHAEEVQQRSAISRLMHDGGGHGGDEDEWGNMTLAERAARDPSVLFEDEDDEQQQQEGEGEGEGQKEG